MNAERILLLDRRVELPAEISEDGKVRAHTPAANPIVVCVVAAEFLRCHRVHDTRSLGLVADVAEIAQPKESKTEAIRPAPTSARRSLSRTRSSSPYRARAAADTP